MTDKSPLASFVGKHLRAADIRNPAGGPVFAFTPKHALAEHTVTGCLSTTFYASVESSFERTEL